MKTILLPPKSATIVAIAAIIAVSPLFSAASAGASPLISEAYSNPDPITQDSSAFSPDYFNRVRSTPYNNGVILGGSATSMSMREYYVSFDSGDSWLKHPTLTHEPELFTASGDGQTLAIGYSLYNDDTSETTWTISLTHDRGATWQNLPIESYITTNSASLGISENGQSMTLIPGYEYGADNTLIYHSSDGGLNWTRQYVIDEQTDTDLQSTFDVTMSRDGSVITAVSFDRYGASISTDYGNTWQPITHAGYISKLRISPDGMFALLNTISGSDNLKFVSPLAGNGQTSWNQIEEDFASSYDFDQFIHHKDGSISIFNNNTHYRSTDNGVTWQTLTSFPSDLNSSEVSFNTTGSIGFHRQINNTEEAYITTDYGLSWETVVVPSDQNFDSATAISHNSQVIAATWYIGTTPFFITKNGGEDWTLPGSISLRPWDIVQQSADGKVILALNLVMWGEMDLVVSRDGGETWNLVAEPDDTAEWSYQNLIVSANGRTLIAKRSSSPSKTTLYVSNNSGQSWHAQNIENVRRIDHMQVSNSGQVIVLEGITLDYSPVHVISRDSGASWLELSVPNLVDLEGAFVLGDGTIYAYGLTDLGASSLSHSTFQNLAWSEITLPPSFTIESMSTSADRSTLLVVGVNTQNDRQAFSSVDNGATWQTAASPEHLQTPTIASPNIIVSANGTYMLIKGYNENYQRMFTVSSDRGITWRSYSAENLPDGRNYSDVAMSLFGRIVLKQSQGSQSTPAIRYSDDGAQSWQSLNLQDALVRNYNFSLSSTGESLLLFSSESSYILKSRTPVNTAPVEFTPTQPTIKQAPQSTNRNAPQKITNTRPTFSGTALPFSVVTVTVNSDPIICTTTADANGNWSCTLPSDIPDGLHTITTVVENPVSGLQTTFGPYYIQVGPDQVITGNEDGLTTPVNSVPGVPATGFNVVDVAAPLITGLGLLVLAGVGARRLTRTH